MGKISAGRISREKLRGKPLDPLCKKAKTINSYPLDNRIMCSGFVDDNGEPEELCAQCGAFVERPPEPDVLIKDAVAAIERIKKYYPNKKVSVGIGKYGELKLPIDNIVLDDSKPILAAKYVSVKNQNDYIFAFISAFNNLLSHYPKTKITVGTSECVISLAVCDVLVYVEPDGNIVFDAE